MAAVQFFGREAVMTAYGERGIDVWAVCQGKELLTCGNDGTSLDNFLRQLEGGRTTAEYALRFYKDYESCDEIDRDTDYHSCYKFKLTEPASLGQMGGMGSRFVSGDPITNEIHGWISKKVSAAIKKELDGDGDEDGDDGGPADVGSAIAGFVNGFTKSISKDPRALVDVVRGIKEIFTPGAVGMPVSLATVAGVETEKVVRAGSKTVGVSPADKMRRVAAAFDRLEACDPNFLVNIEKLANLAETNPAMYNMAVKMLG